jgi:hypothetical protein
MNDAHDFTHHLLANEKLLWTGRPSTGVVFTARDLFLVPFSAVWIGFAVFWTIGAFAQSGLGFALFGVVFVIVGVVTMIGRFPFDALLRSNTRYALTDKRVLIVRTGVQSVFTALALDRLPSINLIEHKNGEGTIRFGQPAGMMNGGSFWVPTLDPTPQLLRIPDVKTVFAMVQRHSSETR